MDEERLLVINGSDMHGDVWIQFPPLVLQVMQKARQVGWAVKTCRVSGRRAHAVHNPVSCARRLLQAGYAASLGVDEAFTCKSPALPGQVDKPGILRTGQETEVSSTPSRFQIFWPLSLGSTSGPLWGTLQTVAFSNLMQGRLFPLRWISLSTDQELNSSFQPYGSSESCLDL